MKIKVEYEVQSKTRLPNKETELLINDKVYGFYLNEEGFISKISITAKIDDPTKFYSEVKYTPNEFSKAHFYIKSDRALYDSIVKEFQDLESVLSFSYNFQGVDWNKYHYELILETEEEREKAKIFSWGAFSEPPDKPVEITEELLSGTIGRKEKMSPLTLFMSFYREGKNDYMSMKYINAFFNFYFVIEGMYGKGKTKNKDIATEFKKSNELRGFVDTILEKHIKTYPKHNIKITKMLAEQNMTMGIDAVIELIVRTRGELHHFNPKRIRGTPFNHVEFHSIAYIVMGMALHGILYRVVDINTGKL
jgi:hypothetical protein